MTAQGHGRDVPAPEMMPGRTPHRHRRWYRVLVGLSAVLILLLIGVTLVADGLGFHIPKGYIYSAMAFSVLVEAINIFAKGRKARVGGDKGGKVEFTPFTGDTGSVSAQVAIAAIDGAAAVTVTPSVETAPARPRTKSSNASRSQSRPKSAPRKPRTPK